MPKNEVKKNIILMGASLSSGNRGVNALTRGALEVIEYNFPKVNIKIFDYSARNSMEEEINGTKVEIIPFSKITIILLFIMGLLSKIIPLSLLIRLVKNNSIKSFIHSHWVLDISEGDSFSDIYGNKRFFQHSLPKLSAILLQKQFILLPQTIGPFNNKLNKKIAKFIIKRTDKVHVRDLWSYDYLGKMKIDISRIIITPDLAFLMLPKKFDTAQYFSDIDNNQIVGINVSGLLYAGGYTKSNMFGLKSDYKNLIEKVVEFFVEENIEVILIPHVFTKGNLEDDLAACNSIASLPKFKNSCKAVEHELSEQEVKYLIGQCSFFIGSRMHSCIAAVSQGVPTVPLAYSPKFEGTFATIGLDNLVVDATKTQGDEIMKTIKRDFAKKDEIEVLINNKISNLKEEITNSIKLL